MSMTIRSIKDFISTHIRSIHQISKTAFWFTTGVFLGLFLLISFGFLLFKNMYSTTVYPGIYINSYNAGGKSQKEIVDYFQKKNNAISNTTFTFTSDAGTATVSARQIHLGYDATLLAQQAMSIGRSSDIISNISLILQAYINGINLSPAYTYDGDTLAKKLGPLQKQIQIDPIDAIFTFENNRVTAFKPSSDGQTMDMEGLKKTIQEKVPFILATDKTQRFVIPIPIKTIHPKITTESANKLGIKELIGVGTSLFQGSIAGRIYNVNLAASRINGALIAPGEVFSFDKTVGDVSSFTGYKQAYVIQNGKTVLGDGGGVCQVSTTLFRAALNAGLPIVERHAHAYRVEYYEEDGPPGIDATVYVPTVDLKFRNDTGHYILIQSVVDLNTLRLTFYLYGVSDGRKATLTTPIVTNIIPAPPPLYTDDPTLPTGVVKQTDFAAAGATVTFSRTVTRGDKTLISETYTSNYQPWQAAYLRGTGPAQ